MDSVPDCQRNHHAAVVTFAPPQPTSPLFAATLGALLFVGIGNSVIVPLVVMRPILLPCSSVNHSAPSGPNTIDHGRGIRLLVGRANSVMAPVVVMRPILLPKNSVNHSAPSGPAVIALGLVEGEGIGNVVTTPSVAIRPIKLQFWSVNHTALSGPAAMPERAEVQLRAVAPRAGPGKARDALAVGR